MKPKDYLAEIQTLKTLGFNIQNGSRFPYAEFYQYNQWTVQLSAKGFDSIEKVTVSTYFDSEHLDYKNKVKQFDGVQIKDALNYAIEQVKQLQGPQGLLAEVFSE